VLLFCCYSEVILLFCFVILRFRGVVILRLFCCSVLLFSGYFVVILRFRGVVILRFGDLRWLSQLHMIPDGMHSSIVHAGEGDVSGAADSAEGGALPPAGGTLLRRPLVCH